MRCVHGNVHKNIRSFNISAFGVYRPDPCASTTPTFLNGEPVVLVGDALPRKRKFIVRIASEANVLLETTKCLFQEMSELRGFHGAFKSPLCTGAWHWNMREPNHQSC